MDNNYAEKIALKDDNIKTIFNGDKRLTLNWIFKARVFCETRRLTPETFSKINNVYQ